MPRVAFFLPDFRIGGAERVALTLIDAFVARGIEVDLVLLKAEGELLDQLPHGVTRVSLDADRIRDAFRPFARYLHMRRPDAVAVSMWPLTLVPIVSRRLASLQTRLVLSDHGILSKSFPDRGLIHRLFLRTSIACLYPRADARIAVSQGLAEDLARLGKLESRSITILTNPIALPRSEQVPTETEVEWGGVGGRVLAVGALKPAKNYPLLLQAFAKLSKSRAARLIILGEGEQRAALIELTAKLGLAQHVTMPGAVADPAPYYASADVMVLSSDHEGFGNVLVEAMQHGLTVVSTDCPTGPREILDGGRYGYLTPCGDRDALAAGLEHALDQPFSAEQLKKRADELSGSHIIDRYLSLILPDLAR